MKSVSSTEIQTRFGAYLDVALSEPVEILRWGQPKVVMVACNDYDRLIEIERTWLQARAEMAERDGYIGVEETHRLLGLTAPKRSRRSSAA